MKLKGFQISKANFKSQKKGVTLIEVLISIAIIALVAAPMLNIYVSSTENIVLSKQKTAATYAAQGKMEEIISLNYYSLLEQISANYSGAQGELIKIPFEDLSFENMYYTVEIRPTGVHYDIFGNDQTTSFVHIIFDVDDLTSAVVADILAPDNLTKRIENVSGQLVLPISDLDYSDNISNNLVYILNISKLPEDIDLISINISAYQSMNFPGMVVYAESPLVFEKVSITPNPGTNKLRTYFSGDDYEKMLVEVEIKAYLQRSAESTILLASIKNTVPMKITE